MILLETEDKNNVHTAEGNSQQIQGAGIIGLELYGNTQQETTIGKNVLNTFNLGTGTKNGVTCTFNNETQEITFNGNCTSDNTGFDITNLSIPFTASTTKLVAYYVSGSITGEGKFTSFASGYQSYDYVNIAQLSSSNNKMIIPSVNTATKVIFKFRFENGTSLSNFKIKIMITDNEDTTFEKFTYGASPNPDYPQNVNVVKGNNTIKVTGKNLFDNTYGITSNVYTTHIDANNPLGSVDCYPINLKPNTNYTLTVDMNGYAKTGEWIAGMCFANGNVISLLQLGSMSDITTTTFTTDSTGFVYVGHRYGFTAGTTGRMDLFLQTAKIQIEQGSTTTEYQPYQEATYPINLGSIELCKIGDYKDYIYKENDKWYKHSEIAKVTLNGSETWSYGTTGGYPRCTINSLTDIMAYADTNRHIGRFICSHFNPNITDGTGHMYQYQNTILCNPTSDITSLNAFKTWLNTNKPSLYYVLSTPTTTEITDTTLISQLEAIINISLYDGENNIILSSSGLLGEYKIYYSDWYKFEKILKNGYIIKEDNDRITQKFANGHRKQFLSPYKDCTITLNLDTIDNLTTKEYLDKIKSGKYKYYSLDDNMYKISSFIIEEKPSLTINNSIKNNAEINDYQVKLLKAGD